MNAPALSVTSSPIVTRFFSDMPHPSSKSRRPSRTPTRRQNQDWNGVPMKRRAAGPGLELEEALRAARS